MISSKEEVSRSKHLKEMPTDALMNALSFAEHDHDDHIRDVLRARGISDDTLAQEVAKRREATPSAELLDMIAFGEVTEEGVVRDILRHRGISDDVLEKRIAECKEIDPKDWWRERIGISANIPRQVMWVVQCIAVVSGIAALLLNIKVIHAVYTGAVPLASMPLTYFIFLIASIAVGVRAANYMYNGSNSLLFVGFPLPAGYVEKNTGSDFIGGLTLIIGLVDIILVANVVFFLLLFAVDFRALMQFL